MAELPSLGQHCNVPECNVLDFLPMKCNACSATLCGSHINYDAHGCHSEMKMSVRVPTCPLCDQPVPVGRNELPDIKVGEHIDRDCQSDPAQQRRKYELQCSLIGCKKRELVRVLCSSCKRNFCLKHRHMNEHDCMGTSKNPLLRKLNVIPKAAYNTKSPTENDEELARTLHAAINSGFSATPEEISRQLAMQLQDEEYRDVIYCRTKAFAQFEDSFSEIFEISDTVIVKPTDIDWQKQFGDFQFSIKRRCT